MIGSITGCVYVSAISIWEISLKYSLKKLEIKNFNVNELLDAIDNSGFITTDLSPEEAIDFHNLPRLKNKDPFDRMLICQAIYNNFYFLSVDKDMSDYKKYGLKLAD